MTIATIAPRVADLEARLEPHRSRSAPPPWLAFATCDELRELEEIYGAIEDGEREATEIDVLRCIEVQAVATRRMLTGQRL